MPARSERIYIFPDRSGQPGLIMRFPVWWDRNEFFKRYFRREIDLGNPIDANYVWILTSEEAISWNEQCIKDFSHDPRRSIPSVITDIRQLESALSKARWLLVESYEWESGLD